MGVPLVVAVGAAPDAVGVGLAVDSVGQGSGVGNPMTRPTVGLAPGEAVAVTPALRVGLGEGLRGVPWGDAVGLGCGVGVHEVVGEASGVPAIEDVRAEKGDGGKVGTEAA